MFVFNIPNIVKNYRKYSMSDLLMLREIKFHKEYHNKSRNVLILQLNPNASKISDLDERFWYLNYRFLNSKSISRNV